MTASLWDRVEAATEAIRARESRTPTIGLVLGSGLGAYANTLQNPTVIPFSDIPNFATSTVKGHSGDLVIGEAHGLVCAVMKGRVHMYEGLSAEEATVPIRVLWKLGARTLVITNSSGGIRPDLSPGELVLIGDHINLTGTTPLLGPNDERFGPRFPDMSEAYDPALGKLAQEVASEQGFELTSGVYAGLMGPTYETPAEVKMVTALGGDLVGMSTVPEVIVARHMRMKVLGISCCANLAAGIADAPLSHAEVTANAGSAREQFQSLVDGVLRRLAQEGSP